MLSTWLLRMGISGSGLDNAFLKHSRGIQLSQYFNFGVSASSPSQLPRHFQDKKQ